MELEKYSMGIGDRFGHQCVAQLCALEKAVAQGLSIVPVWNKSNREHLIVGTAPDHQQRTANEAVRICGWDKAYYVDADHIGMATADAFIPFSNFFTIDVADFIGQPTDENAAASFLAAMTPYRRALSIPEMQTPVQITDTVLREFARKYLCAISEAGKVYRHIAEKKGASNFVTEISVDEAMNPQTPAELLLILAGIGLERIPIQTIPPKFTGMFLKGSDYVGDIPQFTREFQDDLAVINIDKAKLPTPAQVASWNSEEFVLALHHDVPCKTCNLHLRQLLHVGFKVAAERSDRFAALLGEFRDIVAENVISNLYDKHIVPLFLGSE